MVKLTELNATTYSRVKGDLFNTGLFLEPNIKKVIRVPIYILLVVKLLDIIKHFRIGIIIRLLSSQQLNCRLVA